MNTPATKMDSAFRQYTVEECTGREGYPPVWHERLKHEVREAAGHRCIRCHHPYRKGDGQWSRCDASCDHKGPLRVDCGGEYLTDLQGTDEATAADLIAAYTAPVEAAWRILTVHHLDGDKGNCRWWNLAALCQRCHLQIQGKVRMERRWLHEHSDWFRPCVAGYYAWTFLGENLTREQVSGRLDELLALEARQLEIA